MVKALNEEDWSDASAKRNAVEASNDDIIDHLEVVLAADQPHRSRRVRFLS